MADETKNRRDFRKGAASGTVAATAIAAGTATPASAQIAPLAVSPATRTADFVLKNGKVITVDAGFTIAQAIAIAGDSILAVGSDAAIAAHVTAAT